MTRYVVPCWRCEQPHPVDRIGRANRLCRSCSYDSVRTNHDLIRELKAKGMASADVAYHARCSINTVNRVMRRQKAMKK